MATRYTAGADSTTKSFPYLGPGERSIILELVPPAFLDGKTIFSPPALVAVALHVSSQVELHLQVHTWVKEGWPLRRRADRKKSRRWLLALVARVSPRLRLMPSAIRSMRYARTKNVWEYGYSTFVSELAKKGGVDMQHISTRPTIVVRLTLGCVINRYFTPGYLKSGQHLHIWRRRGHGFEIPLRTSFVQKRLRVCPNKIGLPGSPGIGTKFG